MTKRENMKTLEAAGKLFLWAWRLWVAAGIIGLIGAAIMLVLMLTGCTNYGHTRVLPDGTKETTHANFFLQKVETQALATDVTDQRGTNRYRRKVGVDAWKQTGDSELFRAGAEAGFQAAAAYFSGGTSLLLRRPPTAEEPDEWDEPLPPRAPRRRPAPPAPTNQIYTPEVPQRAPAPAAGAAATNTPAATPPLVSP